jgi:hypothetical protein
LSVWRRPDAVRSREHQERLHRVTVAEQARQAEQQLQEGRIRIARDLHDVVYVIQSRSFSGFRTAQMWVIRPPAMSNAITVTVTPSC